MKIPNDLLSSTFTIGVYEQEYIPIVISNGYGFRFMHIKNSNIWLGFYASSVKTGAEFVNTEPDCLLYGKLVEVHYTNDGDVNLFIIETKDNIYYEVKRSIDEYGYSYKEVNLVEKQIRCWE